MELPLQVRFQTAAKKKLKAVKSTTGFDQVEIVRLAVDELFVKYPTDKDLIAAIIARQTANAGAKRSAR